MQNVQVENKLFMKKLLNNQLYIGRTKLSEDDIFKLLDFEYTDLEMIFHYACFLY